MPVTPTTESGWQSYLNGSRLFLPAATNYCTNPSFESGAADRIPTGFTTTYKTALGTPVYSKVAGRLGGLAQRIQYTGVAGDVNAHMAIDFNTAVGSFAAGESVAYSVYYKLSKVGTTGLYCKAYARKSDGTLAGMLTASAEGGNSAGWTRLGIAHAALPALTSYVRCYLTIEGISEGETLDLVVDDYLIEKSSIATPYFDGSTTEGGAGVCAWTGTANASTSTRAASNLVLTDWVTITSAGVVAAGTKNAYKRQSGLYVGPAIITAAAQDAGWQAAVAAKWGSIPALWGLIPNGDVLLPLSANGRGYVKGTDAMPSGAPIFILGGGD